MSSHPEKPSTRRSTSFVFTSSLYPPNAPGFSTTPHLTLDQLRTHSRGAQLIASSNPLPRSPSTSTEGFASSPSAVSSPQWSSPPLFTPLVEKLAEYFPSGTSSAVSSPRPRAIAPPPPGAPLASSSKISLETLDSLRGKAQLSLSEVLDSPLARFATPGTSYDVASRPRGRRRDAVQGKKTRGKRSASFDSSDRNKRLTRKRHTSSSKPRGRSPDPKGHGKRDSSYLRDTYDAGLTLYWVAQKLEIDPPEPDKTLSRRLRSISCDPEIDSTPSLSPPLSSQKLTTGFESLSITATA